MKRMMTNTQIEELNELLVEHGETITAFYDEGQAKMLYECVKGVAIAVPLLFVLDRAVMYGIKKIKSCKHKNQEEES